ncbi:MULTISPECIES: hypothetical protein [unclassified Streptomyces]|uniref:hypothetical protein n=1 Tax=unclassified Streptomyces TaxID=2593676 RepID=UPI0022B69EEA|nr:MULTISPECIES: hypothetical protein [unclassified Streptomyces]MCZ7417016.1 hypothetical protein [Streptomyces sp. WMMC897]MCZ7433156.1 hypothetical protein [Streptomyces sp. WMMC1477]
MIAEGFAAEAESAAEELRGALHAAGLRLPSLHVDERVWDSPSYGTVRLVELGSVPPSVARRLADVVRRGAAS